MDDGRKDDTKDQNLLSSFIIAKRSSILHRSFAEGLTTPNPQHTTPNSQQTAYKMIKISGHTVAWHEGMTISDLLAEIKDTHPYPVVRIDVRYVSRPNFDKTIVPDNSEVFLIPMIAGG